MLTSRRDYLIIVFLTLALLIPFSGKPVHLDDPMYLWATRHILENPLDFYGFNVNWYYTVQPMYVVMKNPPGVSYYLAMTASVFGWGERAIHLALVLPAVAAASGAYTLARGFSDKPLLAAVIAVITPVFLVSSTTIMSDILMLSFWTWAIVFWHHGIEKNSRILFLISGFLIAICTLTKYFGISLIPLLLAYSVFRKSKITRWGPGILLALAILAAYELATRKMYGRGLLSESMFYAQTFRPNEHRNHAEEILISLSFLGGCIITALFYAPLLYRLRTIIFGILLAFFLGATLFFMPNIGPMLMSQGKIQGHLLLQLPIFAIGGLIIITLALQDFFRNKDGQSLLLLLWISGTFVFVAFLNWTVSARAVLPMAPAVGLLISRRLDTARIEKGRLTLLAPLIPSLIVALLVSWADYGFATSARSAAYSISRKYSEKTSNLRYQGHWGFQYYMESLGGKHVDWAAINLSEGDILASPTVNTNTADLPENVFEKIDEMTFTPSAIFSTMSMETGAGFYSSGYGPLPYSIGPVFRDKYTIIRLNTSVEGSIHEEIP